MARKRTGNVQQRSETSFRIRYVNADGIRQHETITGSRQDAERELAIRLGELAAGIPVSAKPNTVLFGELANDVLVDYEVNKFASLDDQEARYRLHLNPIFENRKAAQITTAQIKQYILLRQKEGAKDGTIALELELMRHTFNLALKGRKLLHAPYVPMLHPNNIRTGFFTRDEVDRLCSHLPAKLAAMVLFGFLTGWRLGEIRKLLWEQIDIRRSEIRLHTSKNRTGRLFPMTDELRALLEALQPPRVVFGQRVFPVGDFRKSWATACHKAGLHCTVKPIICRGKPMLDKEGRPRVKVVKCQRTFHDLRRSFAREMDTHGVRRGAIKELAGWKTDSVFNRYNIITESDLRDAVEKINAHRPTPKRQRGHE
jgi:integrase